MKKILSAILISTFFLVGIAQAEDNKVEVNKQKSEDTKKAEKADRADKVYSTKPVEGQRTSKVRKAKVRRVH